MEAVGLVLLYILEPIGHSAFKLEVNGALAEPAPTLWGARGHIPAFRELILIQMINRHFRARLARSSASCRVELPGYSRRYW
jgi:hypothetical protein